jgi:Arc/MetJ family transcription regulator
MLDIDDEALAAAARVLGTNTKKDTVNTALREVVERLNRRAAFAQLRKMAAEGDIDLEGLQAAHDDEKAAATEGDRPGRRKRATDRAA